jgi:hypothetical protein
MACLLIVSCAANASMTALIISFESVKSTRFKTAWNLIRQTNVHFAKTDLI